MKNVCTPCPSCETSLKNLSLRVCKLDQQFVEFVVKAESAIGGSLAASCEGVRNTVAGVLTRYEGGGYLSPWRKALCIIFSGVKETDSADTDKALVKEILVSLDEDRVFLIDAFRLGKESKVGTDTKPRLIKVHVANSTKRIAILHKAKILKDWNSKMFLCVPAILLLNERLIFVAFMTPCWKRKMKLEWIITLIGMALSHNGQ